MRIDLIVYIFSYLRPSIPKTLAISLLALLFGALIGFPLSLARVYGGRGIKTIARGYERVLRGIPILVLMLLMYFFVGSIFPPLAKAFPAAVTALGIRSGAYQSQIFRGALESVSAEQMEAARSLGMSKLQAILHIILPQSLLVALQGWASEYAVVLKDSSYAYILGVFEIMRRADALRAAPTVPVLYAYLAVGLIYLLFTLPVARGLNYWASKKSEELGI